MATNFDAIPQVRLNELTAKQLVALHNSLTDKPVKVFNTNGVARQRIGKLLTEQFAGATVGADGTVYLPVGVNFQHETLQFVTSNQEAIVPVPETDTPVTDTLTGDAGADGPATDDTTVGTVPAAAPKAARGRAAQYADTAVVTVLVDKNPKRPGSGAHDRFAAYKTGMTVAEVVAAGVRRDDINWDVKHGFVSVA